MSIQFNAGDLCGIDFDVKNVSKTSWRSLQYFKNFDVNTVVVIRKINNNVVLTAGLSRNTRKNCAQVLIDNYVYFVKCYSLLAIDCKCLIQTGKTVDNPRKAISDIYDKFYYLKDEKIKEEPLVSKQAYKGQVRKKNYSYHNQKSPYGVSKWSINHPYRAF